GGCKHKRISGETLGNCTKNETRRSLAMLYDGNLSFLCDTRSDRRTVFRRNTDLERRDVSCQGTSAGDFSAGTRICCACYEPRGRLVIFQECRFAVYVD